MILYNEQPIISPIVIEIVSKTQPQTLWIFWQSAFKWILKTEVQLPVLNLPNQLEIQLVSYATQRFFVAFTTRLSLLKTEREQVTTGGKTATPTMQGRVNCSSQL